MTIDAKKIPGTASPWESGELGRNEQNAELATPEQGSAVDDVLGMQLISIRLPKRLIEELKFIGRANGVGYQPLIRDLLQRFVVGETMAIIQASQDRRKTEKQALESELEAVLESTGKGKGLQMRLKAR